MTTMSRKEQLKKQKEDTMAHLKQVQQKLNQRQKRGTAEEWQRTAYANKLFESNKSYSSQRGKTQATTLSISHDHPNAITRGASYGKSG